MGLCYNTNTRIAYPMKNCRGVAALFFAAVPLPALAWLSAARAGEPPAPTTQAHYTAATKPLLDKYCAPCHAGKEPAASLELSARGASLAAVQKDATLWQHALLRIKDGSMPPKGVPAPTDAERTALVSDLDAILTDAAIRLAPRDPGFVVARRLTRYEYDNTVRDLTGVDVRRAQQTFPADGSGGGGFDNNADTLYIPPVLMERYLDAARATLAQATDAALGIAPGRTGRTAARITVARFARRAFRRPIALADTERLLTLYTICTAARQSHGQAVRTVLEAVLVSPRFLFRIEPPRAGVTGIEPLDDYALASRLSYFLWSSLPDAELFALADAGRLRDPAVLAVEAKRLLTSPKSVALSEWFAAQWLRVRDIATDTAAERPDPVRFPTYTPALRRAMGRETVLFCDSVFRENRSLITLLDADYTFVNNTLAAHYGIAGVSGSRMRRVVLKDAHRGGVLTQASVLTTTSYPLRTSPVLRGKWILNEILGTPPPPPPPVVATLPASDAPVNGETFRKRLEKHREKPECAGCHSRMDPLGFGLENFDAIGRFRDTIETIPVDANGALPDGTTFAGAAALKRVLIQTRRDDFLKNVAERMLSYALGRGLTSGDAGTVRTLAADLRRDPRTETLITGIVRSEPFRFRKTQ